MKFAAVFTLLLAVQASASFFDRFSSAFVSVENSFGKLLTDVVSDVKVTIDCTISAVENALSLGGMFNGHSEYERRCKGQNANDQPAPVKNTEFVAPKPIYESVIAPSVKSEKQSVKREIQSSMANVDETIKHIFENSSPLDGLQTVKTVLKEDTTKLDNAGLSLTKELDDITSNVKKEFEQIGEESSSTVDQMLNNINILHKATNQKSDAENFQIRLAYDEVMDAIHSNSTTVHLAKDHTAEKIMHDLEKTSNNTFTDINTTYSQFRTEENKHLDDLNDIVKSKSKDLVETKPKETENKIPTSFKTLAQQIINEKPNTVETPKETTVKSVTEVPIPSTEKPPEDTSEPVEDPEVLMFNAYFGSFGQDAKDSNNEAMNFLQQSRYSQMLMNKVLGSDGAVSVFDNPELLNYR